jgi:hypothetical protein
MTGRYGALDYPRLTKFGFGLGLALFAVGALVELVLPAFLGGLPAWESTLLFDFEVLGVALALPSPVVFGVLLPLTE